MTTRLATSADGTPIAYEAEGTGMPVVLVDGALSDRAVGPARDIARVLSPDFSVYLYDRRGRGESGDTPPYAVEREIEDLAAVMDAAGGEANVLGLSSGGGLALAAAASGVPMRALAAYEPPYVGLREARGRRVDYLSRINELLAAGDRGGAVSFFMVNVLGRPIFMPMFLRLMPRLWGKFKDLAHTLPYDATVMNDFDVPVSQLADIHVPTLVMGGENSPRPMLAAVAAVADAVPDARRVVLADQTHEVSEQALAPVVIDFFAHQADSGPS